MLVTRAAPPMGLSDEISDSYPRRQFWVSRSKPLDHLGSELARECEQVFDGRISDLPVHETE